MMRRSRPPADPLRGFDPAIRLRPIPVRRKDADDPLCARMGCTVESWDEHRCEISSQVFRTEAEQMAADGILNPSRTPWLVRYRPELSVLAYAAGTLLGAWQRRRRGGTNAG